MPSRPAACLKYLQGIYVLHDCCALDVRSPTWVSTVSQFKTNVNTLMELSYANDSPGSQLEHATRKHVMWLVIPEDQVLDPPPGSPTKERSMQSSVLGLRREAANLVESLKHKATSGVILIGSEVFIFIDKNLFVAESIMHKGSSSSKLHNIILELRKMAMNGNIIIHFV
eukprot:jgi/Psemu1/24555/gm1.24555_g